MTLWSNDLAGDAGPQIDGLSAQESADKGHGERVCRVLYNNLKCVVVTGIGIERVAGGAINLDVYLEIRVVQGEKGSVVDLVAVSGVNRSKGDPLLGGIAHGEIIEQYAAQIDCAGQDDQQDRQDEGQLNQTLPFFT